MDKGAVEVYYDVAIRNKNGSLIKFSKNHKTIKDAEEWKNLNAISNGKYEIICVERKIFSKGLFKNES